MSKSRDAIPLAGDKRRHGSELAMLAMLGTEINAAAASEYVGGCIACRMPGRRMRREVQLKTVAQEWDELGEAEGGRLLPACLRAYLSDQRADFAARRHCREVDEPYPRSH